MRIITIPPPSVITCEAGNWSTPTPTCIQDPTICEYKYDITNGSYPIIIQNANGPDFDDSLENSSLNDCENHCCDIDCFAWYFNHINRTCSIINNIDGKYLDTGKPHTELSGGKSKTYVCPAIVIPSVANVPLSTPNTEIQMISLCPVDMKLSSPTITCHVDGTWSTPTPTPTCIPNAQTTPCGRPGKITDDWPPYHPYDGGVNCEACKTEFQKQSPAYDYWEYDTSYPDPSRCKLYQKTYPFYGSPNIDHNNTTSVYGP